MEMYAAESPGQLFPPLSPYGEAWSIDIESIYPNFLTIGNVDLFVNPRVPDSGVLTEQVSAAFARETIDYRAISRTAGESFAYLGYIVRDLEELAQFAQGVAAYAAEQRRQGIPTEDGGLLPRLREGVERFYVTDVEDDEAAEQIAATIPVMFEIPYPEGHPRHQEVCHVLYLDGHVAAVPYGERFPALGEVAALMQGAGALP
jgi:prepilin-type processing-associated H-X9-DG protein